MITKGQAINSLHPNAKWLINVDGHLDWHSADITEPTQEEIDAAKGEAATRPEDKDYAEVVNRLEESKCFLMRLSKEISSTLPQNNSASGSQNEDFDCAEDILKSGNSYLESSLIH